MRSEALFGDRIVRCFAARPRSFHVDHRALSSSCLNR